MQKNALGIKINLNLDQKMILLQNLLPPYPALCCPPDKLACKYIRTHLHASINGSLFSHFHEQNFEHASSFTPP